MSIPEVSLELKQIIRPESTLQAKAVHNPAAQTDSRSQSNATRSQSYVDTDSQLSRLSKDELNSLVAEAQEHLEANNVNLKFKVLEEDDTVQIEIIDADGKTIRKLPEDDMVKLSKSLKNLGKGFLDKVS